MSMPNPNFVFPCDVVDCPKGSDTEHGLAVHKARAHKIPGATRAPAEPTSERDMAAEGERVIQLIRATAGAAAPAEEEKSEEEVWEPATDPEFQATVEAVAFLSEQTPEEVIDGVLDEWARLTREQWPQVRAVLAARVQWQEDDGDDADD